MFSWWISIQGASSAKTIRSVENTPAEKSIKNTSGKQLEKMIIQIDSALETRDTFSTVKELSSEDLFDFFMSNNDSDPRYNKRDEQYHYSVKKITAYLDQYSEGYSFNPQTVSLGNNTYIQKENSIVLPSCAVMDLVVSYVMR